MIKNLLLKLGSDATRTFMFYHGIKLCCAVTGTTSAPLTQLEITPIDVDIPAGFIFDFDCKLRPVASVLIPAGSRIALINSYVGSIKRDAFCNGPAMNLTNHQFRLSIGKTYADGSARVVSCTVLNNSVTCEIPPTLLAGLSANASIETLPSLVEDAAFNVIANFDQRLYKYGYPWNLEDLFSGKVRRVLEGRAFLLADVA